MIRRPVRLAGALATTVLALVVMQGLAPAKTPIRVTQPVHATNGDQDPGRLYSDPSFAIDPDDPLRVVAGFADLRTRRCGLLRSLDGGATWARTEGSPNTPAYPFCSQSQGGVIQAPVAWGGDGMIYMALGGWGEEEAARTSGAILLARSADLGDSWETVVVRSSRGKTGEEAENLRPAQSIAVERKNGNDDVVYVTFALTRPGFRAPNAVPASAMVAVSRDGGRTFGEAVSLAEGVFEPQAVRDQALSAVTTTTAAPNASTTTTTAPPQDSKAAQPNQSANFGSASSRNGMIARVDGKGNAYVTWPTGTVNIDPAPPGALAVSKSTDGGRTWSSAIAIPFSYENARGGPANAYPQMAVTRDGTIHIVYNQNPTPEVANYSEIFHRASYDGGATWTEPKALSDDRPQQIGAQYFPNINVAGNGRIDVAWWDTRDDPGIRANDVYYAYSEDDGRTWSRNYRITDQSVDRRLGVWGANYDITSPPGVGSTNAYAIIGWDDTRNSDPSVKDNAYLGGGLQDIYTSAVQFEAIGGGTSASVKAILAGIVGLVVVGLVLLVFAMAARRRSGPPPAKRTEGSEAAATVG